MNLLEKTTGFSLPGSSLRAFHGDAAIKEKYLLRVENHKRADEIVKGKYWGNGKGCAVGCTIHSSSHNRYEDELGIPFQIAHLQDRIFESLPNEQAKEFPLEFLQKINVGADLSLITPKMILFILEDCILEDLKKDNFSDTDELKISIIKYTKVWRDFLAGNFKDIEEFKAAANNASAYASAYVSAYASAYAYDSAYASVSAVASAYASVSDFASAFAYVYVSAFASAAAVAFTSAYVYVSASEYAYTGSKMKDKLLELLVDCPGISGQVI